MIKQFLPTVHPIKLLLTLSTHHHWKWVAVAFWRLEVLWCGFVLDIGSTLTNSPIISLRDSTQTLKRCFFKTAAVIATFQTHFFGLKLTKIGFCYEAQLAAAILNEKGLCLKKATDWI